MKTWFKTFFIFLTVKSMDVQIVEEEPIGHGAAFLRQIIFEHNLKKFPSKNSSTRTSLTTTDSERCTKSSSSFFWNSLGTILLLLDHKPPFWNRASLLSTLYLETYDISTKHVFQSHYLRDLGPLWKIWFNFSMILYFLYILTLVNNMWLSKIVYNSYMTLFNTMIIHFSMHYFRSRGAHFRRLLSPAYLTSLSWVVPCLPQRWCFSTTQIRDVLYALLAIEGSHSHSASL